MAAGFSGRARIVGDNVNTDYIIASTRKRDTLDEQVLKQFLLETVDATFAASVHAGDILVAGRNFGCGSAMEVAATVILAAGIPAVLAQSFSRSFYRNAVNNGLVPIQCETAAIHEGDTLSVWFERGSAALVDVTTGEAIPGAPMPAFMLEILDAGGVVPYLRRHGRFRPA